MARASTDERVQDAKWEWGNNVSGCACSFIPVCSRKKRRREGQKKTLNWFKTEEGQKLLLDWAGKKMREPYQAEISLSLAPLTPHRERESKKAESRSPLEDQTTQHSCTCVTVGLTTTPDIRQTWSEDTYSAETRTLDEHTVLEEESDFKSAGLWAACTWCLCERDDEGGPAAAECDRRATENTLIREEAGCLLGLSLPAHQNAL